MERYLTENRRYQQTTTSSTSVEAGEESSGSSNNYKRYRSHSETEATIFERACNYRRLMASSEHSPSNNPFRSAAEQQNNNNNNIGINSANINTIRSSVSSRHLAQQQQQQVGYGGGGGSGECYTSTSSTFNFNSVMSKTLSETYLGQYPLSALPRSSSILQMLEHGPLPPPSHASAASCWSSGSQSPQFSTPPPKSQTRRNSIKSSKAQTMSLQSSDRVDAFADSGKSPTTTGANNNSKNNNSSNSNCHSGGSASSSVKRTLSSESVSSQSSVLIGDLERDACPPPTTGFLCIGLQFDK